jgi:cytochrome c biogenesis protein CcdA
MQSFLALAFELATGGVQQKAKSAKRFTVLYVALGLVALTAYGFSLLSLTLFLASTLGAFQAALIVCLGLIAFALFLLVAIFVFNKFEQHKQFLKQDKAVLTNQNLSAAIGNSDLSLDMILPSVIKAVGPLRLITFIAVIAGLNQILSKSKS